MNDNRPQTELLRNTQRGENVIRTVRVKMCLSLAPEKRLQRFHLDVEIRLVLVRVILRTRLAREILLRLVQLLADDARGCHARDRRFVLVVIDRLRVLTQRELDRKRRLKNHVVHTAACRLEQRNLSADGVCAARADCGSRHTGLKCLAEAAVKRIDAVQCTQMRRRRIGILVAVRALKAEAVLVQTDVRMNVNQAGCQHAALAVNDAFAVRRFALAHRGNSAVFKQNPAKKAGITLIHRPNIDIFDQCLIHGKPLPKTVDKCGNLWYIYHGGWESRHAPFISLSPQSYFWRSFARKSAFFCIKAGFHCFFSTSYAGQANSR